MKSSPMKRYILMFVLVLMASISLYAQLDRSKPPKAGPAPEIKIGSPESFQLKNGLKVFVVENHKIPTVAYNLVLDIEAIREGDKSGYWSMAGDLMRAGTTNRTKAEIDEEVDFIGATLNTSPGGIYALSLTKHSEKLLELMTDVLYNPTFPEEEFEKLKKQTLSGLANSKDDPGSIASNVRSVLLYGKDHPYGELTTEETVGNITVEDCRNFYSSYFSPSIAYLVIVGDISLKEAKKVVKKHFDEWEAKEVNLEEFESVAAPEKREVALVDRSNSVQSNINIAYPIDLKKGDPDVIKMRVLNQILGAASDSRLEQQIREKKAFTYYARSTYSSDMVVGNFRAVSEVRNEVTDSAIFEFINEFEKLLNEGVTEDELRKAKAQIMGSFARSLESPQTIANFALNIQRYNLPDDYYSSYLKKVEAVTVDDLKETAAKYIRPDNAYVVVVGKGSDIAEKLKQFGEVTYYDIYGNEYTPSAAEIPAGLTAEKVMDNYLDAIGGEEKARAINDMKMLMTADVQGQKMEINKMSKAPYKAKTDVNMGGMAIMTQIVNGEETVIKQMGQNVPLNEDQKKDMQYDAAIISEIAIKDMGLETKLNGIENIEGKNAYAVEITKPSGGRTIYYYDTETGLKIRTSEFVQTPQGEMVQESDLADYKDISGVKFPSSITLPMGPMKMTATIENIELNTGIDDSEFAVE